MASGTPKHKIRVENDIEKSREEGHWTRVLELATQLSPERGLLIGFLQGEAKLEKYLEDGAESPELLEEAKNHLDVCLKSKEASAILMDTNLLLAKAHFVSGEYDEALRCITASGIDSVTQKEQTLPRRIMRLVAESFAVKGMSMERGGRIPSTAIAGDDHSPAPADVNSDEEIEKRTALLVKATDLALRYLQKIEPPNGGGSLGSILETAIQRVPMVYVQNKNMDKALFHYRSFMNACENPSTLNIRQFMSRQMAETLMRGVSRTKWPEFDVGITTQIGPWKPTRYMGQSLFVPKNREEEVVLLLLISEGLSSRNVVLERSSEFNETRAQSLQAVTSIYDLMTIAFTPIKFYNLDTFERSMKFCFGLKHVWYQFALTLMHSKKTPARALRVFEEVIKLDQMDPVPCLMASKLCIEDLLRPHEALRLAKEAEKRTSREDPLFPKVCLVIGVANALIYESGTDANRKLNQSFLVEAIRYFTISAKLNPQDPLPYMHLSLLMGHQRQISDALQYAQIALMLNPYHLQTLKLVILSLSAMKNYQEALNLCEIALQEHPDHLILLYIKGHLEEEVHENGREMALATARHMLKCWKRVTQDDPSFKMSYHRSSLLTGATYDNQSLRMEQALSDIVSLDSGNGGHGLAGESTSDDDRDGVNSVSKKMDNIHLHIWMMIVELYIQLDQVTEAEACIADGMNIYFRPLNHQVMFARGYLAKHKGNLDEAKMFLQNTISINPKHWKALQQLGHVHYLLGNCLPADKYLRDSLKVDSTQHQTWFFMGLVLDALGDADNSIECHRTALQLEATSPILPFSIIPRAVFD